jgi:hypothetical protein
MGPAATRLRTRARPPPMRHPFNTLRDRYDRMSIPTLQVAFALSLLMHALVLSGWLPKLRLPPLLPADETRPSHAQISLAVHLVPLPSAPAAAPAPPPAPPAPMLQPRAPRERHAAPPPPSAKAAAPVLALARPSPASAPAPAAAAAPAPAPAAGDLSALIEARRRQRAPAASAPPEAPPAETEEQRHNRIVAANLGLDRTPTFGGEQRRGGGIFQIQRLTYDYAEFIFFGWNAVIRRNAQQTIEVRRGSNPSIELAVVRKMIAIIREHESGDFVWQSQRLGRDVPLSARSADNAGLEDFMMQEFFADRRGRN